LILLESFSRGRRPKVVDSEAECRPAHLEAITEQVHRYDFPPEFDAWMDWLSASGWSYRLTMANRGPVYIADATQGEVTHVAEGRTALAALRALIPACKKEYM